jgi:hypothetical protein
MTDEMMRLIRELNDKLARDAMLRQGDPIETIKAALIEIMRVHWESVLPGTDIEAAQALEGFDVPLGVRSAVASALADQKARHDLRVGELLAANSGEVELRRNAQKNLERRRALYVAAIEGLGSQMLDLQRECISLRGPAPADGPDGIYLAGFLVDIMSWQTDTFGPNQTLAGIRDHMRKEVKEIEDAPTDRTEPIDLIMLGISYLRRLGMDAPSIVALWQQRMVSLKVRDWPDWRKADPDKAIEHVRDEPGELPEPRGYAPVVAVLQTKPRIAWGIRAMQDGVWWQDPATGQIAMYGSEKAAQEALDSYRGTARISFATADIERAFRSYLASGFGRRRQPKWHDREWEAFRCGLQARRLAARR